MKRRWGRRIAGLAALIMATSLAVPTAWGAGGGKPAVWSGDFPDPYVLRVGTLYFAYATDADLALVPTLVSADLSHWEWIGNALSALPTWASPDSVWAPSVMATPSGYVMFYAARDAATGQHCISRAYSRLPQGPFSDDSSGPFICQSTRGGSIDPSPLVAPDGSSYLVWKSEGIQGREPTRIWSSRIAGDASGLLGPTRQLITTDQPWEDPIVEGPDLFYAGGRYYLLYSANRWETASYGIGYAVCSSPVGPCTKPIAGPLWSSHGSEIGPGGPSAFSDTLGHWHLAFHAWTAPQVGYGSGGKRSLHVASLVMADGRLIISE